MTKKSRMTVVPALLLSGVLAHPGSAHAFSYLGEYMTSWNGCATSQSGLSQTDDQVNQFAGVMDSHGHTRAALWWNGNVWTTDVVDCSLGGDDCHAADTADIYVLSSHGSAPNDGSGLQTYQTPMCIPGGSLPSPFFDANQARWGGGTGTGSMRWAMLLTCNSVDVHPDQQWDNAFGGTRFEYIMGYRGTSADSFTTNEVAGDWANSAIVGSTKFKAAWFSATSDWLVDDTAEVLSGGTTLQHATSRRDLTAKGTGRRPAGEAWPVFVWSWQQG